MSILAADGVREDLPLLSKREVADRLLDRVARRAGRPRRRRADFEPMSATTDAPRRLTVADIAKRYADGQRLPMLTAYDYPTAQILDEAGVPLILVGDSLGQVLLGYESTVRVTMTEMLHHTKAVVRGTQRAMVIGDMPFLTYASVDEALENAGRFLQEAGAQAVKVEGGVRSARIIEAMVKAGIPVMGHIGWTPQAQLGMGGKVKVQGKDRTQARSPAGRCARPSRRPAPSRSCWSSSPPSWRRPSPSGCASRRSASGPVRAAAARSRSSPTCSGSATSCRATRGHTRGCGRRSREAVVAYAADVDAGTFPGDAETVRMDDADPRRGAGPGRQPTSRTATPVGGIPLDRDL